MSGKGSKQRPTNLNSFEANFERIFGKPKSEKDKSKSKGDKSRV